MIHTFAIFSYLNPIFFPSRPKPKAEIIKKVLIPDLKE